MTQCTVGRVGLGFLFLISSVASFAAEPQGSHLDVDLSILDHKINPCDDFYQYACGGWLEKTEIPADRPMWNRSFSTIDLNNQEILNKILQGYASGKNDPANPYAELLGNFYASCMDEEAIEKNSLSEFKTDLAVIDKAPDLKSIAPLVASLQNEGANILFDFGEEQDAKNSKEVIGVADQGGLSLPDRDYYLKQDPKMIEIRKLYREHVEKMFTFLGDSHSSHSADVILKIETALAKVSLSRVDRRDPHKVYHRLERKGLLEKAPLFDWEDYFNHLDKNTTPKLTTINVAVPDFFVGLNTVLKDTSLEDLKTYLKWHYMIAMSEALPKRFVDERFHFVSTALSGQKQIEARWKRCVRHTNSLLGFALGRAFVDVAYGKEGKSKSERMIHEIEGRLHHILESLSWMDDKTKKQAEFKLSKINNKIGYPKIWRSYDDLKVDRKSFLTSLKYAADFGSQYELNKIGKPVDMNEWYMTPSTVNAYYDPQRNEIVFPAGILQYPFFNRESPDWLNYGAIGVVMGHELTHGFDDEGRQFDAAGNLKNWWDKKVLAEFDKRTSCVVNEYNGFEVLPGHYVNGKLTLGENIADQGGMKLSYRAWKEKQIANSGRDKNTKRNNSPTPEQKFFIAFAQSWCQKEHEAFTRMRLTVDPHSPSRYRVNGVLSQFEPFAKVFQCSSGSKMAPSRRCEVW